MRIVQKRRFPSALALALVLAVNAFRCSNPDEPASTDADGGTSADGGEPVRDAWVEAPDAPSGLTMDLRSDVIRKPWSYIPPQCYTRTEDIDGSAAKNPCYACHQASRPPNFANDGDLQLAWSFAEPAAENPWENLFRYRVALASSFTDDETDAYVGEDNYFDDDGQTITLGRVLAEVPSGWDDDGDDTWDGYVPDCYFDFDEGGYDRAPDGTETGWRVFAYYPFLGTFFPTNGSTDDVLIRLPAAFQELADGSRERAIYDANLAIVEALIRQADVPIRETDEVSAGVDLDADGALGKATVVRFRDPNDATSELPPLRYAGRAGAELDAGNVHIGSGRYPEGTEFLHSVRYLSVEPDGRVAMAPRMKELRYMVKTSFRSERELRSIAFNEALERLRFPDRLRHIVGDVEQGVFTGLGWRLQGFIEDPDGELRPQTLEESAFCIGCHAGIGATTDATFAFPRRLTGSSFRGGWYHGSERGLEGLPDPVRQDGQGEYATYLYVVSGGDEFRENDEARSRFFDDAGAPRAEAFTALAEDVSTLLLPSAARARALNRAYRVNVVEQSYWRGRDAIVAPVANVHESVMLGAATGVVEPLTGPGPLIGLP